MSHTDSPTNMNVGTWSEEEHQQFLKGLEKFGKNWNDIKDLIPTRTICQIRTHAQKYFNKIDKERRRRQLFGQILPDDEKNKPYKSLRHHKKIDYAKLSGKTSTLVDHKVKSCLKGLDHPDVVNSLQRHSPQYAGQSPVPALSYSQTPIFCTYPTSVPYFFVPQSPFQPLMLIPGMQPCFYPTYAMPVAQNIIFPQFAAQPAQPAVLSSPLESQVTDVSSKESRDNETHDSSTVQNSALEASSEFFKANVTLPVNDNCDSYIDVTQSSL